MTEKWIIESDRYFLCVCLQTLYLAPRITTATYRAAFVYFCSSGGGYFLGTPIVEGCNLISFSLYSGRRKNVLFLIIPFLPLLGVICLWSDIFQQKDLKYIFFYYGVDTRGCRGGFLTQEGWFGWFAVLKKATVFHGFFKSKSDFKFYNLLMC